MDLRRFRALVRAMRAEGVAKYSETPDGVTIELAAIAKPAQTGVAPVVAKTKRETESIDEFLKRHITGEVS